LAGMEELFRSTKVEALPIGLWPKLFSDTSNAEPACNPRPCIGRPEDHTVTAALICRYKYMHVARARAFWPTQVKFILTSWKAAACALSVTGEARKHTLQNTYSMESYELVIGWANSLSNQSLLWHSYVVVVDPFASNQPGSYELRRAFPSRKKKATSGEIQAYLRRL